MISALKSMLNLLAVLFQEPDVAFINMVELLASVDVDPAPVFVNWTTRRKYVINRPRICHAKQS